MIAVRLFAALREVAGTSRVEVEDSAAADVGALLDHLAGRFGPEFQRIVEVGTAVVDGETAARDRRLQPGDEVALLPPVSGGGGQITADRESGTNLADWQERRRED